MFSVKLVARPDARMVEVPLEIEAELPREFEGSALLASSGLPRRVRIRATKDALKLSTAYRADQLVGDIVRTALRGTVHDIMRVQDAVMKFIRAVRERRQDGATLLVSSNGRGKIEVAEQNPGGARTLPPQSAAFPAVAVEVPRAPAAPDRVAVLERRVAELEAALARAGSTADLAERLLKLEQRLPTGPISRANDAKENIAGPGLDNQALVPRPADAPRRSTAIEAYAEGLRTDLRTRAMAAAARAGSEVERSDRAAALAADAELLGAPQDGTAQRLRDESAQAAARGSGLKRLAEEIEFYPSADLSLAAQLLAKLEETAAPNPAPALEGIASAVVRAERPGEPEARAAWLQRACALCGWVLVEPKAGESLEALAHEAVDSGGSAVVAVVCPGLKRADGSVLARARVRVGAQAEDVSKSLAEVASPALERPAQAELDLAPGVPAPRPPEADGARALEPAVPADIDVGPSATLAEVTQPMAGILPAASVAEPAKVAPLESIASEAPAMPALILEPTGHTQPLALLPAPRPTVMALLDLSGESPILPGEAAAAAVAASRVPKVVAEDPSAHDEALAAAAISPALEAVPYEIDDSDVEEVHSLVEPLGDETEQTS